MHVYVQRHTYTMMSDCYVDMTSNMVNNDTVVKMETQICEKTMHK